MSDAMAHIRKAQSPLLVTAITVVALLLGWGLKLSAESRTREVRAEGVAAYLPAQWVFEPASQGVLAQENGDPNRVITSWDPLNPGTMYSVSLLPHSPDASLAAVASFRNLQRAQALTAYRVLDQTPVALSGREGYRVLFAYVDAHDMGSVPVVYQGADYYFLDDGHTLIASLETHHDFEETLAAFKEFAAGVHLGDAR